MVSPCLLSGSTWHIIQTCPASFDPPPCLQPAAYPTPAAGCVPDAETAKRIACVVWRAMYGDDVLLKQEPLQVDFAEDVWTIRGSPIAGTVESLVAVVSKKDSRILKVGTVVFRREF
jgi:hypothetical protein